MQWKGSAAAIGMFLVALVLAQGGCEPRLPSLDQPPAVTESNNPGPTEVTTDPAETTQEDAADTPTAAPIEPAAQPAISPQPVIPRSPGASASPSAVPKPSRVAASSSPTAQPPAEVVLVSLAKDNRIAEVDAASGKLARIIDLSEAAGKMTLAPDGHSAWALKPGGTGSTIADFDVRTGDRNEDIRFHEADKPSAVAFSSDGSRAYIASGASVIFASTNGKEFGRIGVGRQTVDVQVPRRIDALAVSRGPNGEVLYAADQSSGVVWAMDGGSGALLNEIDVGGGPTALITDPSRQRAYVLADTTNQIVAIDTTTQRILGRLNMPATPSSAAVGRDGTLYVAGGDTAGEIWVVARDATDIRAEVPIGGRPVGIALGADGKTLFIPDAANNNLDIISADTIQVIRTLTLASEPVSVLDNRSPTLGTAPVVNTDATPSATPALVAAPTPLPEGALLPDKLPSGAVAEPFVSGAALPAALAFAADGRLFYAEQHTGRIRVVQNGQLLLDPFYQFLVADQPNAGLLGLTLDPDFQNNHYIYALYTAPRGTAGGDAATGPNEVVRLTDVNSKGTDLRPVLQDLPSAGSQNSAALRFGPDNKLYLSLADDDKGTNAQDLSTLAGKILRVNPDGSVPADNPFAGQSGKQDAIWAYGLHNVYSFAFHPIGHQLLAVESGEGERDTLDLIARGGNYGWPAAAERVSGPGGIEPLAVIKPSIGPTGSTFYMGDQIPNWKNDWFYCDSVMKQLRRVHLADQSFDRIAFEEVVKQGCSYDVATGPDGALYYSDAQGIYRIVMVGADALAPVTAAAAPAPTPTPRPG